MKAKKFTAHSESFDGRSMKNGKRVKDMREEYEEKEHGRAMKHYHESAED